MSFQTANTKANSGAGVLRPGFEDRLEPIPGAPLQRSREALRSYNIAKLVLNLSRQVVARYGTRELVKVLNRQRV